VAGTAGTDGGGEDAGGASVAETHSAVVVFLGDRAYKVKKPLDLGFLDFRTREARQAVCHREVELNRRLAPDVYLGVADVTGPDGELCDHLVVMRRLPPDRRLSALVRRGEPVDDHLEALAGLVADLHRRSPRSEAADAAAEVGPTRARWADNTRAMEAMAGAGAGAAAEAGAVFDPARVAEVQRLAERYLEGREPLLARRVEAGRAVDGHGDLLADDVFCLDDGPQALDCIEFDDGLRLGDGLADAAFLAMDLERLGRPDLAARFLAAYRERAGDAWPASLAHHHVAYRAQVRAKVTAIRATQTGDDNAAAEARSLLDLALSHLEAGRVGLVLVGGLPGTGKSTLAAGLARALGARWLRSDEVRKELLGGGAAAPAAPSGSPSGSRHASGAPDAADVPRTGAGDEPPGSGHASGAPDAADVPRTGAGPGGASDGAADEPSRSGHASGAPDAADVPRTGAGPGAADANAAEFGRGMYSEEATARTYDELLERAREALGLGETVVLDASWTAVRWREAAREVAEASAADLVELRCQAPPDVAAERIRARAAAGGDPSDATPAVAAAMAAREEPWPEATTIDAAAAPDEVLHTALQHLGPLQAAARPHTDPAPAP
jgi:uncharacterized protein